MPIMEKQWYTGEGEVTKVELRDAMITLLSNAPVDGRVIMIGTDAQKRKKRPGIDFVTVVAVHNKGKGGVGFWARERFVKPHTLYEKLMRETMSSLEVAFAIMDVVPDDGKHEIVIHVDANRDERYASSRYYKVLEGMVTGQGFKAVLKPHAWVSSHMADHLVKNKYIRAA